MDKLTTNSKYEICNFVNVSMNSVSANSMTITDDVVETVCAEKVKEELDLLTR
jgi:hypothetical protein